MKYKTTKTISKEVIDEILDIKKNKLLTPENIVEQAKSKDSALHDMFEWDNTKASEQWRLQQARVLLNEIKVIVDEKELFAFENVSIDIDEEDNGKERIYVTRDEIFSNVRYKKQILKQAINAINHWQEKYNEYKELKPIFTGIKKVKNKLKVR